jgi:thiol:disulfide interchange protein DsbD
MMNTMHGITTRRSGFAWLFALLLFMAAPVFAARPTTAPVETVLSVSALPQGSDAKLAIVVDVPEGLHAQSATPSAPNYIPFKVTPEANPAVEWGAPTYPAGKNESYPSLGVLNVYTGRVVVFVPLKVKADAPPGPIRLEVKLQYQMCDDKACYAPRRPTIATDAKIVAANTSIELNRPELFAAAAGQTAVVSNSGKSDKTEWTVWTAFGAALLAGLLFNVMPCVLPVLPLKAAAFHRAAEHHRSRSILLGTAFSIGIIAVFAVLAVLVLVLRVISWGSLFSNPWFVWSLVVLLVVCAFGMFGAINITLPTALYNVDPRQDTFGGNVIFGAFTAILATPCTAPLLPPLLLWATNQPVLIGVPAMLLVGVGMALPYLILSAFPEAAKKFPRTGPWAELFKQMMGFLLLASATYFAAGRLIHGPGFWWMVVAVAAIAALFLIARTVQLTDAARPVGIAATLSVALVALPLAWTLRVTAETPFQPYTDQQFAQLRTAGKPILVKFTANWCGTCQYIEGTVFTDARVLQALKQRDVTPLKVDFSDNDDAPGKQLLLKLNPAGGIPLTAIFAPGKTDPVVLSSVYSSSELLEALDAATGPVQTAAK